MTISATLPQPIAERMTELLTGSGVTGMQGVDVLRLVRAVNNAYDSVLTDAMRDGPVTPPRWRILLRLWLEEQMGHSAVNPTHLSRTQQVSKNTISEHLRGLEEAGLVERELDLADRRQFKIRLTEEGRAVVQRCTPGHVQRLNELIACLTPQESEQLIGILNKLHEALRAECEGTAQTGKN